MSPSDPLTARLQKCAALPPNSHCADCTAMHPEWASCNLGIFICIECSGAHRNLGTHISKVMSTKLDEWSEGDVARIEAIGNEASNAIFEANLRSEKPQPASPLRQKHFFIRAKYELRAFCEGGCGMYEVPEKDKAQSSLTNQVHAGILFVTLIQGRNLISRDPNGKSDPYVVFHLAQLDPERAPTPPPPGMENPPHHPRHLPHSDSGSDPKARDSLRSRSERTILQEKSEAQICAEGMKGKVGPLRSTTKGKTLEPRWGEKFQMNVRSHEKDVLVIACFDEDLLTKDDSMGSGCVYVRSLRPNERMTRWVPLTMHRKKGLKDCGELELEFEFVPLES